MTMAQANRYYKVALYALMEEIRVMKDVAPISPEEKARRHREIYDMCYGEINAKAKRKSKS